jgi:protein O-GlcNAc transferase
MKVYCEGSDPDDSSLECADHTRVCKGRNILFDFKNLKSKQKYDKYREDVILPGDVGGHCKLNSIDFKKQGGHKSPLQSWFAELGSFEQFDYKPIKDNKCDIVIKEPTFLIKLDAGNITKNNRQLSSSFVGCFNIVGFKFFSKFLCLLHIFR